MFHFPSRRSLSLRVLACSSRRLEEAILRRGLANFAGIQPAPRCQKPEGKMWRVRVSFYMYGLPRTRLRRDRKLPRRRTVLCLPTPNGTGKRIDGSQTLDRGQARSLPPHRGDRGSASLTTPQTRRRFFESREERLSGRASSPHCSSLTPVASSSPRSNPNFFNL